jgi:hypothetical protein
MKKKKLKKLRRRANDALLNNFEWAAEMPDEVLEYIRVLEDTVGRNLKLEAVEIHPSQRFVHPGCEHLVVNSGLVATFEYKNEIYGVKIKDRSLVI